MDILYPSSSIYVAQSSISGLGVFAREEIREGEVVEECLVILVPGDQLSDLTKTRLLDYYFAWGVGFQSAAVCLGFGSLYNHSYKPNAKYIKDEEDNIIRFVAIKNIKRDEEIIINYNGHPEDKTKLWFEAREKFGKI